MKGLRSKSFFINSFSKSKFSCSTPHRRSITVSVGTNAINARASCSNGNSKTLSGPKSADAKTWLSSRFGATICVLVAASFEERHSYANNKWLGILRFRSRGGSRR